MRSMIITKETDYALRILRVLLDGEKHSVACLLYTSDAADDGRDV